MATTERKHADSTEERRARARRTREHSATPLERVRSFFGNLGPGLITGAADDDPSGIATYSQAGAAYGYGLLWTALVSLPLMAAVQLMCARIGFVTRSGLASVLRQHYSRWLLWSACFLLLLGNTINIAADLGGMAAAAALLTGWSTLVFIPLFAALLLALLIFASYERMTRVLKWLTLALFAYILAGLLARPDWPSILAGTVAPRIRFTEDYLLTFVAILGTTISPYLFFWQAAQSAEEREAKQHQLAGRRRRSVYRELRGVRRDVYTGMFFSNLIMYFVILTTGATLHAAGQTDVQTAQQAAAALRPLAGSAAALLFAAGIVGTGMLGVPVLAGSAAYAVAEAGAWRSGMNRPMRSARHFYGVMTAAMLVGMALTFAQLNAMKFLFWSAVINGLLAPPLIIIVLLVCNNGAVMGRHRNGWGLNVIGTTAALIMSLSAGALIISWVR